MSVAKSYSCRLAKTLAFACVVVSIFWTRAEVRADFRRGDVNRDNAVNISDAIFHLMVQFRSGGDFACLDAADADDDGELNLADATTILEFLFGGGAIPAPSAATSGPDPTCDSLDCGDSPSVSPAVVISEIHYNDATNDLAEFVELLNRTPWGLDLSTYRFTNGIAFAFPEGTLLPPGERIVVARDPRRLRRSPVPVLGPYDGGLRDSGERLTLTNDECVAESVAYDDRAPWPLGADGYGSSLERLEPLAAADDPHNWRASTLHRTTPGEVNSTRGTPLYPLIVSQRATPAAPTSADAVTVELTIDIPLRDLTLGILRWEGVQAEVSPMASIEMRASIDSESPERTVLSAIVPPQPSQTLVVYNFQIMLATGTSTLLPAVGEPSPFFGFFVFDYDIPHELPLLWMFPRRETALVGEGSRADASGAAALDVGSRTALAFPRAQSRIRTITNGQKLKFLKGREYRGDRTINIIPELGGGGSGVAATHMEELGMRVFRELGVPSPRTEFFRLIDFGASEASRHTQSLVIQQVNERFLAMNGFNEEGDLYKLDKSDFAKRTNLETGLADFFLVIRNLRSGSEEERRALVFEHFNLESVGLYSAIGILIGNWDGFHNNMYVYEHAPDGDKFALIPWDLDQVFQTSVVDLPLTWPLDGQPLDGGIFGGSREPGPISRPYHSQPDLDAAYRNLLRELIAPGGLFTVDAMEERIRVIEDLLLADLDLQEQFIGEPRDVRRGNIRSTYAALRQYVSQRIAFLEAALGEP